MFFGKNIPILLLDSGIFPVQHGFFAPAPPLREACAAVSSTEPDRSTYETGSSGTSCYLVSKSGIEPARMGILTNKVVPIYPTIVG
jgi:hypothetical protein